MPLREEQPAFNGFRCCFSSLINTLSVLALHAFPSLPSSIPHSHFNRHHWWGVCKCVLCPLSVILSLVYGFILLLILLVKFMQSGSGPLCGQAGIFLQNSCYTWVNYNIDHSAKLEVSQKSDMSNYHCCLVLATLVHGDRDQSLLGVFTSLAAPPDNDRVRVWIWRLEQKKIN